MTDVLHAAALIEFGHLDALDAPTFVLDEEGRVVFANEASHSIVDVAGDEPLLLSDLFPAEQRAGFREVLAQVELGHSWSGRLETTWRDQRIRSCEVACAPIARKDGSRRVLCVVDAAEGDLAHVRAARRATERLARLGRVVGNLAASEDMEAVRDVVVLEAADVLGATVGSMSLLVDPDTLVLVGLRGGKPGAEVRWSSYSVHDNTPAGHVVRSGSMLLLVGREQVDALFPDLEKATEGDRSMVCLPLIVTGQTIGVITWSFPGRRRFESAELEFLTIVADSCAQTIERIHARDHSAEQAARVRFLADVTATLATSLDYASTLTNVAKMAVPRFADWCAIDLLDDGRLHRLAVEHVDPSKVQLAMELQNRYPADPESGGAWEVIRSGTSMFIGEVTEEMIDAGAVDEEQARGLHQLQLRSLILAPLVARSQAFGVMTLVMADSERRYNATDVPFVEDLAGRAAVAIDNAQLYSQTHEAAVRLQHAVLPQLRPSIAGWQVATHYTPAGRTEVGGDFYDVIELPNGDVAMFLGDVMGRGVGAAAAMAQTRAALRAYIAIDPSPQVVVDNFDRLFDTFDFTQLVTLVYAVLSRDGRAISMVNAGHPTPLLVHRDGTVTGLGEASGPPLGTGLGGYDVVSAALEPGEVLLAFSDGLIERRDEDIDEGLVRAATAASRLLDEDLAGALEVVVDGVRDHSREDDVAAMALRLATREQAGY